MKSDRIHSGFGGASGFTLLELLVVIGILAMLAGICVPALSHARQTAKLAVCLSDLRQMCVEATAYTSTNRESFPLAYYNVETAGASYHFCWDLSTLEESGSDPRVVPGLLWEGSGAVRIQQCPSFDGAANWLTDPFTGYNYNTSFIGHGDQEAIITPLRTTQLRHPATVALFGDGQWAGGANKFMRAPWPNPGDLTFTGRWAGTQGFRHLKQTNVAFCDGHTETLKQRYVENADGSADVAAGTGFLSKDNSLYNPQ